MSIFFFLDLDLLFIFNIFLLILIYLLWRSINEKKMEQTIIKENLYERIRTLEEKVKKKEETGNN